MLITNGLEDGVCASKLWLVVRVSEWLPIPFDVRVLVCAEGYLSVAFSGYGFLTKPFFTV